MKYYLKDKWLNININTIEEKTIQDFFDIYFPSKKIQHLLIQNRNILIDNKPVKRETEIIGTFLQINIYPNRRDKKEYISQDIKIVYEDEILLIVYKPKGILVHNDGNNRINLTDILLSKLNLDWELLPIHRLDIDTDGLVVYSKSPVFHPLLDKMLENKEIQRIYLAYILGHIDEKKGFTISKPISKDRHINNKMIISKHGDQAITKVKCIKSFDDYSILECSLLTGRTHQIRVHLSSIGFPIINDPIYGKESLILKDMGLTAYKIEFIHPLSKKKIIVKM